jgi:hypothetical protein
MLSEHAATTAVPNSTHRIGQRSSKGIRAITITFEQMEGNALGRFLPDARHAAQAIDKANQ